jgi:TPR repeat protein
MKLYKKVIASGSDLSFYTSHAYFNLGLLYQFGSGIEKNTTKALVYYNTSTNYESSAIYPYLAMKYFNEAEDLNLWDFIATVSSNVMKYFIPFEYPFIIVFGFLVFYSMFLASIITQKE